MAKVIKYNGKEMAHVDKNGFVIFTKGPDLNPLIDKAIGSINQVEDDMGNVIFEQGIAPLEQKLAYMVKELGFEIDDS